MSALYGSVDRHGNVTVSWNVQGQCLSAGDGLRWLPCHACGKVGKVPDCTVSHVCLPRCTGEGWTDVPSVCGLEAQVRWEDERPVEVLVYGRNVAGAPARWSALASVALRAMGWGVDLGGWGSGGARDEWHCTIHASEPLERT